MIIKSFNLTTANKIKIVEFVGCPRNSRRRMKNPYYKTTIYTKISQDKFHTEIKDAKEIKVFESDISDVEDHIHTAMYWLRYCYPYLDYTTNIFYDQMLFELYIDDDQVLDEEKIKSANYLKELYHNLMKKYSPENIKIVRKIYYTICHLVHHGENLSSDSDVVEYFIKNGITKIRGIGKKRFEDFEEYFNLKMSFSGDKLLLKGDILVQLEWDKFELDFCNTGSSKYKMNEIFRKTKDGSWISLSGKFTNLSDKDINLIQFNILSSGGKFEIIK